MKKVLALVLALSMLVCFASCSNNNKKLSTFYDKLVESRDLLDSVADAIYDNWYDAIYEDKFSENINLAILSAQIDHSEDLDRIEALDAEISDLFRDLKDDKNTGKLVKEVMSAYSDYYEFVVNVSGSFKSYSADKETYKKELASLLKDLSYEL